MPIQPTDLLLGVWERLDYYTALVMEAEPADVDLAKDRAKAGARAIAEVLAPMMVPFFTDADSIVREAVERYKHRLDTEYETPGLGQKSLAPHDKMPMQTAPVKTAPAVNLTEKEQAAIKMALESKMFTAEQLAKSYNVPVAAIKALASN